MKKAFISFSLIAIVSLMIAGSAWADDNRVTNVTIIGRHNGGTGGASAPSAAGGTVTGVVKGIATGAAISGAVISDGTHSATSGSTGAYTLNEPAGSYTLTISKSGYLSTNQVAAVTSGTKKTLNWALTKSYGKQAVPAASMSYVILAWNDLGMHCDQDDYSYFGVLPPFNTLHA